jgi:hypothetical protein
VTFHIPSPTLLCPDIPARQPYFEREYNALQAKEKKRKLLALLVS